MKKHKLEKFEEMTDYFYEKSKSQLKVILKRLDNQRDPIAKNGYYGLKHIERQRKIENIIDKLEKIDNLMGEKKDEK